MSKLVTGRVPPAFPSKLYSYEFVLLVSEPPLLETDRSDNPMREQMYTTKLEFEAGRITVPTLPGLGVEPDKKAMREFCVQQTERC